MSVSERRPVGITVKLGGGRQDMALSARPMVGAEHQRWGELAGLAGCVLCCLALQFSNKTPRNPF